MLSRYKLLYNILAIHSKYSIQNNLFTISNIFNKRCIRKFSKLLTKTHYPFWNNMSTPNNTTKSKEVEIKENPVTHSTTVTLPNSKTDNGTITTESTPPADSEIRHLAVYGTLRDDDDSGAAWTTKFIKDITCAESGRVISQFGIEMYWSQQLGYPFALLLQPQHNNSDNYSSPDVVVDNASSTIIPSISVRVLYWASEELWKDKLKEADEIEGYNAHHEDTSEYVRRKVQVQLNNGSIIWCWIYVALQAKPETHWVKLIHGDWLRRNEKT